MANYLILDFEGVDGATSWTEPNGPNPVSLVGCEIDTAFCYLGSSSLKALPEGRIDYKAPSLLNTFAITFYFRYHDVDENVSLFCIYGSVSYIVIDLTKNSGGDIYLGIMSADTNNNSVASYYSMTGLSAETWHKAKISVNNRDVLAELDDNEIGSWVASMDDPFSDFSDFFIYNLNSTPGNDVWLDHISIEGPSSVEISSVLTGVTSNINLSFIGPTSVEISSVLTGVTSDIEIFNEVVLENINVQFSLLAITYEDIPVISEWIKGMWEMICTQFIIEKSDFYNFYYIPVLFQVMSSDVMETIPIIFSIIKKPQSFDSYVMQKLYCVTTNYSGDDLNLLDWNVSPNQIWYVAVEAKHVVLYETRADMEANVNPVAEGTANDDLEVYLSYVDEYEGDVTLYYQDVTYHLTLSGTVAGVRYFKVKPLTDLSEIRDPIYNNSNIVLSRGEAELNIHTYTILGKDITLATHIPEMEVGEKIKFTSVRRKKTKIGQILSHTIEGTLGRDGETSLINTVKTAEYMELSR